MYWHVKVLLQLFILRIALRARRRARQLPMPPVDSPEPSPPRPRRKPRIHRVRKSVSHYDDQLLIKQYRFDRATIYYILDEIRDDIKPRNANYTSISPLLKLLSVLSFCGTGSFQIPGADRHGLSQPMFSKILNQVMGALLRRAGKYIYMPRSLQEVNAAKAAFYQVAGFPHVIGAIDGTHIPLVPPRAEEQAYRNRKSTHSLNAQMVCGPDLCFQHVCARFPGSAHDARVMRMSTIVQHMERHVPPNTILLGDSGYPLLPWLITPLRAPSTPAEERYNKAHIRTRNLIERAFGVLKTRFRCLDRSGGALLYSPAKVSKIVVLCCILHNIAIRRKVQMPDEALHEEPNDGAVDDVHDQGRPEARTVRQNIIDGYFTR